MNPRATHVHPDHAGSALGLARAWQAPVYLHPAEMDLATARDLDLDHAAGAALAAQLRAHGST